MSVNAEQTVKAVAKVVECFEDGFQFGDLLTAAGTAIEIAEQFTGLPGGEKKAFVLEVIKKAYKEVDPDIPWIPSFVETPIENFILNNLLPPLVDYLVGLTKKPLKVNETTTEG